MDIIIRCTKKEEPEADAIARDIHRHRVHIELIERRDGDYGGCVSPHELAYRGCNSECDHWDKCEAEPREDQRKISG